VAERLCSPFPGRSSKEEVMNKSRVLVCAFFLHLFTAVTLGAEDKISHSFLATGAETFIHFADGKPEWTYPLSTRDGWVLPNGNLFLTVSKGEKYPGGAVVEITRAGQVLFEYQGTQSEVNTAQKLANGHVLLTEAGANPRLLELDSKGGILTNVPLTCQTTNHHMESRMARKLPNGNYLVPQLLDQVVREYDPQGLIVSEVKTPHWPLRPSGFPTSTPSSIALTGISALKSMPPARPSGNFPMTICPNP